MVYFFKTPLPKARQSVRFTSSPAKSGRQLQSPTNLKSTVGQYSRTDHTNTVIVTRLEPPVPCATVKIYPPPTFDDWADLPTAVSNISLTAINLPLLLDSPATDLNKPLKNKSILKSTMKNILPPARAPCASRSTSEGADPVAFDDNVNIPAALGASPVPDNMPTHPTLYKGSLAFGSPRGSKLTRVHQFPSPNTTSADDQKLPAKKKRRTSKPVAKPIVTSTRSTRTSTKPWLRIATSTTIRTMSATASFQSKMQLPSSRTSRLAQWLQLPKRLQNADLYQFHYNWSQTFQIGHYHWPRWSKHHPLCTYQWYLLLSSWTYRWSWRRGAHY